MSEFNFKAAFKELEELTLKIEDEATPLSEAARFYVRCKELTRAIDKELDAFDQKILTAEDVG